MEEAARVYAESLFEAARDTDKLDVIHEQLGQYADALAENRDMQVFFFSPYFSALEKRDAVAASLSGAEPEVVRFLEVVAEKHRMPDLFRIRKIFDELWAKQRGHLDVTVRSAVELDPTLVSSIGAEIGKQTGKTIELHSEVDPGIIGGLVLQVGNMVLDASIQNRLRRLHKEVARAA